MPLKLTHPWAWILYLAYPILSSLLGNYTNSNRPTVNQDVIVELAIVCDKEFGEVFQNDHQKILEYWTVFLADLSLRFKTLPSSNISFLVTSITVMSSHEDQSFIENVRSENGTVKLTWVISEFAKWAHKKRDSLPKFDVAMGVTAAPLDGYTVGVAYGKGACLRDDVDEGGKHVSVVVISDRGTWSVGAAAHELGHLLGAQHDAEVEGCNQTGFIMSGMAPETQYFFSACSDRLIAKFLKTYQSDCLKKRSHLPEENETTLVLPTSGAKPPSIKEQCQRLLKIEDAYVDMGRSNCKQVKCARWFRAEGYISIRDLNPVDGSPCGLDNKGVGSCFRGMCLPIGFLIENIASGKCLRQENPLKLEDHLVMSDCKNSPTLLDKFFIFDGKYLATPYSIQTSMGVENGIKCVQIGEGVANIRFFQCSENTASIFQLKLMNESGVLLDDNTGKCIGYNSLSDQIMAYSNCSRNDSRMLWKLVQVFGNKQLDEEHALDIENIYRKQAKEWSLEEYWGYILIAWVLVAMGLVMTSLLISCQCRTRQQSNVNNVNRKVTDGGSSFELDKLTTLQNE